jgi:hypothetical protein
MGNTFRELAQVADQVERSGISSQQFQKLAFAANQAGVSVAVLAKATRQLRVDMADAAAGDAKKLEMFRALGITMEQLRAGDASAVFMAISQAISGSADDSERLLIATAFFGDKIGNDILPLLNDYVKLTRDVASAPVVDDRTLAAIARYEDGIDRLSLKFKVLAGNIVAAYDKYSAWASKLAEDAATGLFDLLDRIPGFRGSAASATTAAIRAAPLTAALVAAGANGNTSATATTPDPATTASNNARAQALVAAIKAGTKGEKDKSADTKGAGTTASSVSGNVIGVGQNPVVSALQEQTQIAKEQRDYLAILASRSQTAVATNDITNKGATPSTPATRTT